MMDQREYLDKAEATVSVGDQLKKKRESRGLSIDEVAGELFLDGWLIRALESDDFSRLPEPIYVRGYLQNYARLLGLDPQPLLQQMHQLLGQAEVKMERRPSAVKSTKVKAYKPQRRRGGLGLWMLIVVVLAAIAIAWWITKQNESQPVEQGETALLPVPGEGSLPIPMIIEDNSRGALPEPVEAVDRPEPADSADTESMQVEPVNEPSSDFAADDSELASVAPAPPELSQIVLQAEQDSWVEITDATGKRVVYDLLKAGTSRVVEGAAPFDVLLGFAPGMRVTLDGESFDFSPYIMNNKARFQLGTVHQTN